MEARLVYIDGEVADLVTPFESLASAFCEREIKVQPSTLPHSIRRLCVAGGLSEEETAGFMLVLGTVPNFWQVLQAPPGRLRHKASPDEIIVYAAHRISTAGKPVLQQTVEWLEAEGIHNPVVWITEEE